MKWKREAELVINNTPQSAQYELKNAAEEYCNFRSIQEVPIQALFAHKPELAKVFSPFVQFRYEKCGGPIQGLSCSDFHRNLFATISSDGYVRVFNMLQNGSVLLLEPSPEFYPKCIVWSPIRPLILLVGSANGITYVYDLAEDLRQPVTTLENLEAGIQVSVECIAFNKHVRDFVSVAYSNGEVLVFQLSQQLSNIQPGELKKLSSLIES